MDVGGVNGVSKWLHQLVREGKEIYRLPGSSLAILKGLAYTMSESIIPEGRVALVTGAGRGIGRAISLALAGAGARLIVLARTSAEVQETAQLIHAQGGDALAVTADVSQWNDVCRVVSHAAEQIGPIDILVNNAGIQSPIGPTG